MYALVDLLSKQDEAFLEAVRDRYGLRYESRYRWNPGSALARQLRKSRHIKKRYRPLRRAEREMLALAVHLGRPVAPLRLGAMLRALRGLPMSEEGSARGAGALPPAWFTEPVLDGRSVQDILLALRDAVLLLPYTEWYSLPAGTDVFKLLWAVPVEVENALGPELKEIMASLGATFVPSGEPTAAQPLGFQRDAVLVWSALWRMPARVLKSGQISKRDVKRLVSLLSPGHVPDADAISGERDVPYLSLLLDCLLHLGLSEGDAKTLAAVVPWSDGPVPRFWQQDPLARAREIWKVISELSWNLMLPPDVRSDLLSAWRHLRVWGGEELSGQLGARIKRIGERLKKWGRQPVSMGLFWTWLLEPDGGTDGAATAGHPRALMAYWEREVWLVTFLLKVLHWAGFLDLYYEEGHIVAARLSQAGEAVVSDAPWHPPQEDGQVVVQPNFQVLALGPVALGKLAVLGLIAPIVRVERGVVEYALARKPFLETAQALGGARRLIEQLASLSTSGLPQNVRRSLEEWAGEHERITVYEGGALVMSASPEVLNLALSGVYLSEVVPLTNTMALVPTPVTKRLLQTGVRKGVMPALVSGVDEELAESITVDGEGTIRSRGPLAGVFVLGTLARVAEPQPDGTWRLTRESVARAAVHLPVDELLALLERMSGQAVPRELARRVRVWAGYFGHVRVYRPVLLQFRSEEVLQALRDLPEFRRLLKPFTLAPGRGLAVVSERRLSEVLDRLAALGVEVEGGHQQA